MRRFTCFSLFLLVGAAIGVAAEPATDLLIADFEGTDYGPWRATGTAFGAGPAQGTLPNQMPVSGYEGKGLVNSFAGGDAAIGTLTSPAFTIERPFLRFLIGGGMHPGETCLNLLRDGQVVRTATGPNDRPGGTEQLSWFTWDVADLVGQTATLEIVDRHTGGWGHINVDQIVQTVKPRGTVLRVRQRIVDKDYLSFQIGAQADPRSALALYVDGVEFCRTSATPKSRGHWISWNVAKLQGRSVELHSLEVDTSSATPALVETAVFESQPRGLLMVFDQPYHELYRPQFHFSAQRNWLNDPNGLVFHEGEYHLFFQHNPAGTQWGNMTWGHAVSPDLVHWKQLEHALLPDKQGTMFSGSAVVDWRNTSGLGADNVPPLIALYTAAGGTSPESQGQPFTQGLAYSRDRGRTWTKFEKNPVLGQIVGGNRDPKVVWHEPSQRWVMALYLDKSDFALFASQDLKSWTRLCDVAIPGASECPDFFELPVDGKAGDTRWVFWGANGRYLLGRFDGRTFQSESEPLASLFGANDYAAQTYSDIPASDGRRIQIAWMAGGRYPAMPFNQQMTFPRELTLRTTPSGVRLHMWPVREISLLRGERRAWRDLALTPGQEVLAVPPGELWDGSFEIDCGAAKFVTFSIRGEAIRYDVEQGVLTCLGRTAAVPRTAGRLRLRILVDRTSLEIFAAEGLVTMCSCFLPDPFDRSFELSVEGGPARLVLGELFELRSAWKGDS